MVQMRWLDDELFLIYTIYTENGREGEYTQ